MSEAMKNNNKSLKILQVISTPPFAWVTGGCARVVFDLSRELVKQGHEVTILTTDLYEPNKRYPIENPEIIEGVRIIRFKYISDILAWKYKIYISPGMITYLKKHLGEYEIVHLQDFISPQAYFTSKYCKKYGIPYIITTHGSTYWVLQKEFINQIYLKFAAKKILNGANKIVALTKMELEHYSKIGISLSKVTILPNGIDLLQYKNIPKRGIFKIKNGFKDDKIVLYLGRINKIKGIEILIKAFADLTETLNSVKLVIVGPDEGFMNELKDLTIKLGVEELVLFTGPLYDEEKLEAYVDADVYVLPSKYETFPITVLESWACGIPVIVTYQCGIANYVKEVGLVIRDESQLKDAMFQILTDSKFAGNLSKLGKEMGANFEWTNVSKKLESLYYGVLVDENHNNIH